MKRTSIRFRLTVLMICIALVPIVTVTLSAARNTRDSVEQEIINANSARMRWAQQYLTELIRQIDALFYSLQINQDFMTSLSNLVHPDIRREYEAQNYIQNTLITSFYTYSQKIDELTLYNHTSGLTFSVNFTSSGTQRSLDILRSPWKRMTEFPVNMYFKQVSDHVVVFHSVNRFTDKELLGGFSARVNQEVWEEVRTILQSEAESSIYIVNDQNELLAGSTENSIPDEVLTLVENLPASGSNLQYVKKPSGFYFLERVDDGELIVIKTIPLSIVSRSSLPTITTGIVTGILFAAVSLILSVFFSFRISKPIVALANTMRHIQIENFEFTSVKNSDEIGLLEEGYNMMMHRIKELIQTEYKQEIELKNAQLLSLQAQINPHFLNNTLTLIGGMALTKDAPEIYEITRVVGDLLRYSISRAGYMVSLQEELEHMKNYLFIQEQRFTGRFSCAITADEALLPRVMLPRFILQPVVENAFEHGLQKKAGKWKLEVEVKQVRSIIYIMIKDNGNGISPERLKVIRRGLSALPQQEAVNYKDTKETNRSRSIGLKNIDSRLKIKFGPSYGLRIFSTPGKQTLVLIRLPGPKKVEP